MNNMSKKVVETVLGSVVSSGGSLAKTQDFRSLEDQIGEIIFLATGGSKKGAK